MIVTEWMSFNTTGDLSWGYVGDKNYPLGVTSGEGPSVAEIHILLVPEPPTLQRCKVFTEAGTW